MCSVQIKNGEYFLEHLLSHNRDNIECKWCSNKEIIPVSNYMTHYKLLHKNQCVLCNKKIASGYGLRFHLKLHENARNYKCPIPNCKSAFVLFGILKRHILERHSDYKRYKCPHCSLAFSSKDNLIYHRKKYHESSKYICSLCGKKNINAEHYKLHMRRHLKQKSFTCDVCGYSTTTSSELKKHQKYCRRKKHLIEPKGEIPDE